jgi:hypothetical protein
MQTKFSIAMVAVLLAVTGSAEAIVQVNDLQIGGYGNEISPSGSHISTYFTARATATDIASGVTFSLQERDPDGNDLLFDVRLNWAPPFPALGTELRVGTGFQLRCDQGQLVAMYISQWFVSWCDPNLGAQVRSASSSEPLQIGTSEPENFEFVLVDEAGNEAGGTAEDAFHCGTQSTILSKSPFRSPFELVSRGESVATPSDLFSRGEPGTQAELGGTIQIAFDPLGEQTCGAISVGVPTTLYIVARRSGPAECGVTGAELRLLGMPSDWYASAVVPTGAINLGDVLGSRGANMAYGSCQRPGSSPVLLYTVQVLATSVVSDHMLRITARTPPANPNFDCPLITLCDVPQFSIVCMAGSMAWINPSTDAACHDVSVSIEPRAWGAVKDLYR